MTRPLRAAESALAVPRAVVVAGFESEVAVSLSLAPRRWSHSRAAVRLVSPPRTALLSSAALRLEWTRPGVASVPLQVRAMRRWRDVVPPVAIAGAAWHVNQFTGLTH